MPVGPSPRHVRHGEAPSVAAGSAALRAAAFGRRLGTLALRLCNAVRGAGATRCTGAAVFVVAATCAFGALAQPAVRGSADAPTYPTRPVRIIVGLSPGGSVDIIARLMGQWLSDRLGQQFIVENRPGAASNIATESVVRSPPDGYTLLIVLAANAINATLYDKLNFNLMRDIALVAGMVRAANVMEVNPAVPAATVPEFIAYAKANPGKLSFASGGRGSSLHVVGELFKMMAGVDMVHVPYRGGAPALIDLLGGQVQVMFDTIPQSIEYIRSGKLRALAVTTSTRSRSAAGRPDHGRFRARFRGRQLVGRRRAGEDAGRDRRPPQQGDQRRSCRPEGEEAVGRARHDAVVVHPGRIRQVRAVGNRQMGEGGDVFRRQGVILQPPFGRSAP